MLATDAQFLNRRLGNQQFLTHAADLRYYDNLVAQVNGLARPGENLSIPDVAEAGAWTRLYSLYLALKRRAAAEPNRDTVFVAPHSASDRLEWDQYVSSLTELQAIARRENSWPILSEYLNLGPGDLGDPVAPGGQDFGRGDGRPPGWRQRAARVTWAVTRLKGLSPQERERVGELVAERRREARLHAIEQRLAAIETRLPSMKEVVLKEEETNYGK
jgi:hypothetical protein